MFNHEASCIRCMCDYTQYPGFLQPKRLRFRGKHKLRVQRAPEPGNIIWENLEESTCRRAYRKAFTATVTLVFLGISFMAIYYTKNIETALNTNGESES
ncbi:unnamed protein product, partial [Choristocarpus tenellus]